MIRLPRRRGLRPRLVAIAATLGLLLPAMAACDGDSGDATGCPPKGSTYGSAQKTAVEIGKEELKNAGFGSDQWSALCDLWHRESAWKVGATNSNSGAYGIPQALPAYKMGDKRQGGGSDWKTNPRTQIQWGLVYIKGKYGTPRAALKFWHCTTHKKSGKKWVRTRASCGSGDYKTANKKFTWY